MPDEPEAPGVQQIWQTPEGTAALQRHLARFKVWPPDTLCVNCTAELRDHTPDDAGTEHCLFAAKKTFAPDPNAKTWESMYRPYFPP